MNPPDRDFPLQADFAVADFMSVDARFDLEAYVTAELAHRMGNHLMAFMQERGGLPRLRLTKARLDHTPDWDTTTFRWTVERVEGDDGDDRGAVWEMVDPACGRPALRYVGAALPRDTDDVDYRAFRHLDGTPVAGWEVPRCGACGRPLGFQEPPAGGVFDRRNWRKREDGGD